MHAVLIVAKSRHRAFSTAAVFFIILCKELYCLRDYSESHLGQV